MEWVVILGVMFFVLVMYVLYKTRTKPDPLSLTHDEIKKVLTQFKHPEVDGVCYGFTLNWAQDVAQGKEEIFYQKLSSIRAHRTDLPKALKGIRYKEESSQSLTPDDKLTKTLPNLFEKISIAQDPDDYREKYGALIRQPDITAILTKINSDAKPAKHVFYKTHTFSNKAEAVQYFNFLKKLGLREHVAVVISTADHAMGFKRMGNDWLFIDINKLYQQDKDIPYFKVSAQMLVDILYDSCFDDEIEDRLTVNTDFISAQDEPYLNAHLKNAFPVFPFNSTLKHKDKLELFKLAAIQGDMITVRKCINAGLSVFSRRPLNDNSPIVKAIEQGRREVFRAMLQSMTKRINERRKSDGATMLHLACKSGGSGIVEELLQYKKTIVDAQDLQGMTPLMHACRLTTITNDERLIELLLVRGASLTVTDNEGLTALDHAQQTKHKIAERLILEKLESDEKKMQSQPVKSGKSSLANIGIFGGPIEKSNILGSRLFKPV